MQVILNLQRSAFYIKQVFDESQVSLHTETKITNLYQRKAAMSHIY